MNLNQASHSNLYKKSLIQLLLSRTNPWRQLRLVLSLQTLVLTFNMCTCAFLYKHHTSCCYSSTWMSSSFVNFKNKLFPVSAKIHIYMKIEIYSKKKTKKRVWTIGIPLKRVKEYILQIYFFVLYGRFLCLRCAGWGVPLVEFGWSQPEVRQTPGGPLRPAWPLSPGRPVCPLSPGFPGWPLKALPGRPGWPVIRATVLTSFTPNYLKV